jgi:addiction module HigA family antidote
MFNPPHPGEVLREFLPDGETIESIARKLGVSRVQLSGVLNGKSAVSPAMAIRIALGTDTTPESWLTGQMKWDLWTLYKTKAKPKVRALFNATLAR